MDLQTASHRIAHMVFGDGDLSPALFVSEPDGLVRWTRAQGGFIRPVLRLASFSNQTDPKEALFDRTLSSSSSYRQLELPPQVQYLYQLEGLDLSAQHKRRPIDVGSATVFDWSVSAPSIEIEEIDAERWMAFFGRRHGTKTRVSGVRSLLIGM